MPIVISVSDTPRVAAAARRGIAGTPAKHHAAAGLAADEGERRGPGMSAALGAAGQVHVDRAVEEGRKDARDFWRYAPGRHSAGRAIGRPGAGGKAAPGVVGPGDEAEAFGCGDQGTSTFGRDTDSEENAALGWRERPGPRVHGFCEESPQRGRARVAKGETDADGNKTIAERVNADGLGPRTRSAWRKFGEQTAQRRANAGGAFRLKKIAGAGMAAQPRNPAKH